MPTLFGSRSARKYGGAWLAAILLLASASFARELTRAERYVDHVKALTSARMEGRGAGTQGLQRAADYIVSQFRRLGLQPAAEHNSYLQPFIVTTGARLKGNNLLLVRSDGREEKLKLNEDYIPLSFSSVGTVSGPVVFAGYGISAGEFGYDDYLHFDVKDKIVVVLRYEPQSFSKRNGHEQRSHHAHLITKAINARNRGAKAVVLVNGKLPERENDELLKFGRMAGPSDAGIVMVQVKNEVVDGWLQAAGKSLAAVQQEIDKNQQPQSFALADSFQLQITVAIERTRATVHNALAYLPGESDEYIVVGAHYDHLGRGGESSLAPSQIGTIHPGADDNASGTAALLELAREFSSRRQRPKRGVLFAAFSGE
ncbi:MAG TPA: M28 family peptidase, partial [Terriglobales bacterium]|nr:M28 family peptidase [Terriglobales bacterium]